MKSRMFTGKTVFVQSALILAISSPNRCVPAEARHTEAHHVKTTALSNGTELQLMKKLLLWHLKLNETKDVYTTVTVYYLDIVDRGSGERVRIWNRGFLLENGPIGFLLSYAEDLTTPVALAVVDFGDMHFFEINPKRPLKTYYEEDLAKRQGKPPGPETPVVESKRAKLRANDFFYKQGNILGSPQLKRLWRSEGAWNVSFEKRGQRLDFRLPDDGDEWVLVEKEG